MSGKYPFVANFQIAFLRTFALDYTVISLHTNTVTYFVEKRLIFHEEINKTLKNYLKILVFIVRRKKIKFKKCARAILDSDDKMPSCYRAGLQSQTLASLKPEISQVLDSLLDEITSSTEAKVLHTAF